MKVTQSDIQAYLIACFEEAPDDAAYIAAALGDVARARGMTKLAKRTGLTRMGLYKALSKDGNPSLDTALKVLHALGLHLTATAAKDGAAHRRRCQFARIAVAIAPQRRVLHC